MCDRHPLPNTSGILRRGNMERKMNNAPEPGLLELVYTVSLGIHSVLSSVLIVFSISQMLP